MLGKGNYGDSYNNPGVYEQGRDDARHYHKLPKVKGGPHIFSRNLKNDDQTLRELDNIEDLP